MHRPPPKLKSNIPGRKNSGAGGRRLKVRQGPVPRTQNNSRRTCQLAVPVQTGLVPPLAVGSIGRHNDGKRMRHQAPFQHGRPASCRAPLDMLERSEPGAVVVTAPRAYRRDHEGRCRRPWA